MLTLSLNAYLVIKNATVAAAVEHTETIPTPLTGPKIAPANTDG